jgi:hypothetical protein
MTRLKENVVDGNKYGADEKGLSSKSKQSVVTTLKLFASQNCKPELYKPIVFPLNSAVLQCA